MKRYVIYLSTCELDWRLNLNQPIASLDSVKAIVNQLCAVETDSRDISGGKYMGYATTPPEVRGLFAACNANVHRLGQVPTQATSRIFKTWSTTYRM